MYFVRTLHTNTYLTPKWEGMGIYSAATAACQIWGVNIDEIWYLRVKMPYSEGGPSNG